MRIVDFATLPDRSEYRDQLREALEAIDLDGGQLTEPLAVGSAVGLGLPDDLTDDEVRAHAEDVRAQVEDRITEDAAVRFELVDGQAAPSAGSPDHLE